MLDRILNPSPTFYKWDKFLTGFFPGMILPLLSIAFFYLLQMDKLSLSAYTNALKDYNLLAKILGFGCILNLGLFFIFLSRDYFNAARGVIGATILYSMAIVVIKFIL